MERDVIQATMAWRVEGDRMVDRLISITVGRAKGLGMTPAFFETSKQASGRHDRNVLICWFSGA